MEPPRMHCHEELTRDLGHDGFLPDEVLHRWFEERYSTSKHLLSLYSAVRGLRARHVVEVGFGRSSFVLARAVHENGGQLTTCDLADFSYLLSPGEQSVTRYLEGDADLLWQGLEPGIEFAFLDYFSADGFSYSCADSGTNREPNNPFPNNGPST